MKKWLPAGIFLAIFFLMAVSSADRKSATWDETPALGLGLYLFENMKWNIPTASIHPPLSYYIHSLPLIFSSIDRSCFKRGRAWDIPSGIYRGQCLLKGSDPSGDRLLFRTRLTMIVLGVILGFFVYNWAKQLFGNAGGLLSLFLYSLSPNILAHARLITPDISLTTFGFITAYYFWKQTGESKKRQTIMCGLFLGLTLLCKFSALIWVPILLILTFLATLFPAEGTIFSKNFSFNKRPFISLAIIFATALLVIIIGYGFQPSHYFAGIRAQEIILGQGIPSFLKGTVSKEGGWWYYYLYAFLIKVPIPLMLLILISAFLWRRGGLKGWFDSACIVLPIVSIFFAFSVFTRVNVGLRYILPLFPFLMLLPGSLAWLKLKRKILFPVLLIPFLSWYAYENLSIYPHYLAYFNQFIGGPKNGYKHLVDSNLDWGQDLKGLKAYMDRKGIDRVKLSYFGTADPSQYGIKYEMLQSYMLFNQETKSRKIYKGDIVAISATNLYPIYMESEKLGEYLLKKNPTDHIGYSILIYEIE